MSEGRERLIEERLAQMQDDDLRAFHFGGPDAYDDHLWLLGSLKIEKKKAARMEEALRLLLRRSCQIRQRLNGKSVSVPLWDEMSWSRALEVAEEVLGDAPDEATGEGGVA